MQTVFRANLDSGYTKISNAMLQDQRLTYESRGLLAELLSRPANWEITIANIIRSGPAGRDKVYRMMAELERHGYAASAKQRRSDGAFLKHGWRVTDDPALLIERTAKELDKLLPENPDVVIPFPGKPDVAKEGRIVDQQPTSCEPETAHPLPAYPDTAQPDPANPHTTNKGQLQSTEVAKDSPDSSLRSESAPMQCLSEIAAALAAGFMTAIVPAAAAPQSHPVHIGQSSQLQLPVGGEALSAVKSVRQSRSGPPTEYTMDFVEFWKLYPRQVGKGEAFKQWQRLTLEQKRRAYRALKGQRDMLLQQAQDSRGNFCPHPRTWICQGRFDDEPGIEIGRKNGFRYAEKILGSSFHDAPMFVKLDTENRERARRGEPALELEHEDA